MLQIHAPDCEMARSALIVDDSSTVRRQLRTFLEGPGVLRHRGGANSRERHRRSARQRLRSDHRRRSTWGRCSEWHLDDSKRSGASPRDQKETPIFVLIATDSAVSTAS